MASGEPVFEIHAIMPPNTLAATFSTLLGTSTPTENFPIWVFDKDESHYLDFHGRISENYDGGGFIVQVVWSAAVVTINDVLWSGAFRAVPDDLEDLDTTAHTYVYNLATVATAPSVIGEVSYDTIAFDDGVDSDSVAAGAMCVFRLQRDADAIADDLDDDAQLHRLSIIEA